MSLHKCFRRVETASGSVWIVDETEYQRRKAKRWPFFMSFRQTFGSIRLSSILLRHIHKRSLCTDSKSQLASVKECIVHISVVLFEAIYLIIEFSSF
ncbi:unnamed protein product [Echinostoma caproni]|uniref:Fork-head domain-containing protein n=1 Tax=Echinostoma caproni TaxID=27848 RepID=A0A3P8JZS7_9TREM|nr:unnamed protein product [Echinostoma caproni]